MDIESRARMIRLTEDVLMPRKSCSIPTDAESSSRKITIAVPQDSRVTTARPR